MFLTVYTDGSSRFDPVTKACSVNWAFVIPSTGVTYRGSSEPLNVEDYGRRVGSDCAEVEAVVQALICLKNEPFIHIKTDSLNLVRGVYTDSSMYRYYKYAIPQKRRLFNSLRARIRALSRGKCVIYTHVRSNGHILANEIADRLASEKYTSPLQVLSAWLSTKEWCKLYGVCYTPKMKKPKRKPVIIVKKPKEISNVQVQG
jgi:ribonuclease HI